MWLRTRVHDLHVMCSCVVLQVFYCVMPGITVKGRPAPNTGERLTYQCNGIASFWATNAVVGVLHYYNIFRLEYIMENLGAFIIVAMVAGDLVSAWLYVAARIRGIDERMSGNVVYDYFL